MADRKFVSRAGFAFLTFAMILAAAAVVYGIVQHSRVRMSEVYSEYQIAAAGERQQAAREIYETCNGITPEPARQNCIIRELQAAAAKDSTNKDLQAQQDMAFWGEAIFWASVFQISISGLGIYWIVRTFEQTGMALRLNKSAVAEAKKANVLTSIFSSNAQNATQAQLRAYVTINQAESGVEEKTKRFCIWVTFKNSGQTPAYEVVIRKGIEIRTAEEVDEDSYPNREVEPVPAFIIGPGDGARVRVSMAITKRQEARLKSGKDRIIAFGICNYEDINGKEYFTEFNLEVVGYGTDDRRVVPAGKNNGAT